MTSTKLRAAILGASGYTGAELIRWLNQHPNVTISALSGDSQAGKSIGEVYPHLARSGLPHLQKISDIDFTQLDVVFCCLPHATTQEIIKTLPNSLKIIDLSADFRLRDAETYAKWYGRPHQAEALQKEAVYGLTEIYREEIKSARLVANPGCYPTGSQLALIPLLEQKLIHAEGIVIDAKSGVTGAGRKVHQPGLFTEVNESFQAYGIGKHRHIPEIEQGLSAAAGTDVSIRFTPHLLPISRGILSTHYVKRSDGIGVADLKSTLRARYEGEPFTHILDENAAAPSTAHVRGTNDCLIGIYEDHLPGHAIIVTAIDNVAKGAASQAVHNMNLMFGFEETTGLQALALFP